MESNWWTEFNSSCWKTPLVGTPVSGSDPHHFLAAQEVVFPRVFLWILGGCVFSKSSQKIIEHVTFHFSYYKLQVSSTCFSSLGSLYPIPYLCSGVLSSSPHLPGRGLSCKKWGFVPSRTLVLAWPLVAEGTAPYPVGMISLLSVFYLPCRYHSCTLRLWSSPQPKCVAKPGGMNTPEESVEQSLRSISFSSHFKAPVPLRVGRSFLTPSFRLHAFSAGVWSYPVCTRCYLSQSCFPTLFRRIKVSLLCVVIRAM